MRESICHINSRIRARYIVICILSALYLVAGGFRASGQESLETYIRFKVDRSLLDEKLGNNADKLSEIINFLQNAKSDSLSRKVDIYFCGAASPEGPLNKNRMLATKRRKALEDYIRARMYFPDSIVAHCDGVIYDWAGLVSLVEASDMPHKDEAVDIIRRVPEFSYDVDGQPVEIRKQRLKELQDGRTWRYMLSHFFPQLRYARIILEINPVPVAIEIVRTDGTPAVPAVTVPATADVSTAVPVTHLLGRRRDFIFALKTNLLYDALTLPNIGAEFRLDDRWSISTNWMYGWWKDNFTRHYYLRAYGGEVSLRRWLGHREGMKPFTGHHVGVYGQLFTYDFRKGSKGYMGGRPEGTLWDKVNYAAGLEYGYSVSIGRRLNLDMSIGVGYMYGPVYDYTPDAGCKVWQRTRTRSWFGPTKAEVSLVWILGKGGWHD